MTVGRADATGRRLRTLLRSGALGGLTDAQLLERFTSRHDQAAEDAFATLVERHGPMVWRVCRDIVENAEDTDDAAQATFLVLARNARTIRDRDSLGSWLFGVACRVSGHARVAESRRRARERRWAERERIAAGGDEESEAGAALYDEVARLPQRYRLPIVLHYFEGLTYAQAAQRLGCPVRTIQTRLARARDRLRARLSGRGLTLGVGMLRPPGPGAIAAGPTECEAAALARMAARFATGGPAALAGGAATAALAGGMLRATALAGLRRALAAGLVVCVAMGLMAFLAQGRPDEPEAGRRPAPPTVGRRRPALPAPHDLAVETGRGTTEVYARDANGERIFVPGADEPGGEQKRVLIELRWVVLTGILDHRELREGYAKSLHVDPARFHPEYRRVEVEQQQRGPDGAWSEWAAVNRDKARDVLDSIVECADERLPGDVRLAPLVEMLPFLRTGTWRGVDVAGLFPPRRVGSPPDARGPHDLERTTTEAPRVLIRSLDFGVEPGKTYRYRTRVVVDDRESGGRRGELAGAWSEPSPAITVPRD
jgi:RNA polymerase sigma factor (sigma-70 family)